MKTELYTLNNLGIFFFGRVNNLEKNLFQVPTRVLKI